MHIVYGLELDLRYNDCIVCDGSMADPRAISKYTTFVKLVYVRLLDLIGDNQHSKVLMGD